MRWHNLSSSQIALTHKSQVLNEFVKFEYPQYLKENSYDLPHIEFIIAPSTGQERFFIGCLPIINLHKNHVYCEEVRLIYVKDNEVQITNKGENLLNVQMLLKSR